PHLARRLGGVGHLLDHRLHQGERGRELPLPVRDPLHQVSANTRSHGAPDLRVRRTCFNGRMTATPPPPPTSPYQQGPQPMSPADERLWSTLTHVGALVLSGGGAGWLVALIAYLILKDRGPFVRSHTATE